MQFVFYYTLNKIFVGEYSVFKYGYSADSICADALDKIFVVPPNKYELTPKWFCFGSYLVSVCKICEPMVSG